MVFTEPNKEKTNKRSVASARIKSHTSFSRIQCRFERKLFLTCMWRTIYSSLMLPSWFWSRLNSLGLLSRTRQLQKIRLSKPGWPRPRDLAHSCPTSPSSTNIYRTPWLLFVPIQESKDQKINFFTGYDRDHFLQKFLSHFEHVDWASQKRSPRPICGIARLCCTLASSKVWSSEPAACLRSSIAKWLRPE